MNDSRSAVCYQDRLPCKSLDLKRSVQRMMLRSHVASWHDAHDCCLVIRAMKQADVDLR